MSTSKNLLYINIMNTFIDKHNHMICKIVIIYILKIDLSISLILYAISRKGNQTTYHYLDKKTNTNWELS